MRLMSLDAWDTQAVSFSRKRRARGKASGDVPVGIRFFAGLGASLGFRFVLLDGPLQLFELLWQFPLTQPRALAMEDGQPFPKRLRLTTVSLVTLLT